MTREGLLMVVTDASTTCVEYGFDQYKILYTVKSLKPSEPYVCFKLTCSDPRRTVDGCD